MLPNTVAVRRTLGVIIFRVLILWPRLACFRRLATSARTDRARRAEPRDIEVCSHV